MCAQSAARTVSRALTYHKCLREASSLFHCADYYISTFNNTSMTILCMINARSDGRTLSRPDGRRRALENTAFPTSRPA